MVFVFTVVYVTGNAIVLGPWIEELAMRGLEEESKEEVRDIKEDSGDMKEDWRVHHCEMRVLIWDYKVFHIHLKMSV